MVKCMLHHLQPKWKFVYENQSFHTGIIPCAAKRFSTQKTMSFELTFFSSTRNGSTVLAPELYDDRENPFGPIQARNDGDIC